MAGVTREDVFAAADRLASEGRRPTLASVREALGGGSYATIHPLFVEWRKERSEKVTLPTDKAPTGVVDRVNALVAVIWQQAVDDATSRFEGERRALQQAAEKANQRADEAEEALAQCAGELDRATERADQAEAATVQAKIEAGRLAQELGEIRQVAAGHEAARAEADGWIADLRAQLDQARSEAVAARQDGTAARLSMAETSGKVSALEALNADLMAKLTPAKKG